LETEWKNAKSGYYFFFFFFFFFFSFLLSFLNLIKKNKEFQTTAQYFGEDGNEITPEYLFSSLADFLSLLQVKFFFFFSSFLSKNQFSNQK